MATPVLLIAFVPPAVLAALWLIAAPRTRWRSFIYAVLAAIGALGLVHIMHLVAALSHQVPEPDPLRISAAAISRPAVPPGLQDARKPT